MTSPPLISVAMAMRDAEHSLALALASIEAQSLPEWELILLDDGSRDGSVRIAQRFAGPRLRLVADGARRGLAARLNQAVAMAHGKYVARMDADDVCYPERFERQAAFLEANPDVSILGTAAIVFEGDGVPAGLFAVRATHAEICARPWAGFYLPHPTWMGRIEWFRAHRYNEGNAKAEDQELLLCAHDSSRFAALIEPLLGYRQDRIELGKVLRGRYDYARAVLRNSAARRAPFFTLRGVGGQLAKAAFDTLAIAAGMERRMLRHRARPLPAGEAEKWREVWRWTSMEAERRCAE